MPFHVNSTNSFNFNITLRIDKIGELVYRKWYSFDADIFMADGREYELKP
ncbi:hypothetical protein M3B46_06670 [Sphingobacterium daejeonense]|nr:hypothetical protein [Sphingobacterium daejeonense]MCT1530668.1 hypothetical protein [Sphingobacterium daejeonense]